jgi:hypothetical protein
MSTTAKTSTDAATITRRTRSFGLGWTNDVEQTPTGLRVKRPASPGVVGTPAQVSAELDRARRINSGNDWRRTWFLGGRPVVEAHGIGMEAALEMLVQGTDDTIEVRFID